MVMSRVARAYWLLIVLTGFGLSAYVLAAWRPQPGDWAKLALYIADASVASVF